MGEPRTVRACKKLIIEKHPSLVLIIESKLKSREAENLKCKWGFNNGFWVDCMGEGRRRARGLGLLWNKEVDVKLLSFSHNHIDVQQNEVAENNLWRFTGFYGHSEENKKYIPFLESLVSTET